jgi:hypothetical protein
MTLLEMAAPTGKTTPITTTKTNEHYIEWLDTSVGKERA